MDITQYTTQQQREALTDMVKGGEGTATGTIRETEKDGVHGFVALMKNPCGSRYEPLHIHCGTYEEAYKVLHIGELGV